MSRDRGWGPIAVTVPGKGGVTMKNRIFQLIVVFAGLAAIAAIVTGLDMSIRLTEK